MTEKFWKNRKVIIYIALLHHTRFLIPITDELSRLGAETQYIVGQAERSQEVTAAECNLNFKHVFDYLSGNDFHDINENYLKQRLVFGNALKKNVALGVQMVTVIDKTLHATAQEYIGFRNLLQKEKPDICIALHELNRWGKMLAFWAKKMNIPFITLQEGLGYNLDFAYTGHLQYSTLGLTWGERIRKKLGDYEAPIERIIPVGNTHITREKKYQKKNSIRKKMRKKFQCSDKFATLLIFSAIPLLVEKVMPLFKVVSDNPDLALFVKFHPADKQDRIETWIKSIPENFKKRVYFIHGQESTYDLLALCDLCTLAQPSTTGLEALAFGKPLVQLDVELNVEVPYSFSKQKVAMKMTSTELAKALQTKKEFSNFINNETLQNYLKYELTELEGATDKIINIAQKLIEANKFHALPQIIPADAVPEYNWSIILPVPPGDDKKFLFQLESISVNSENPGEYEVILLIPEQLPCKINEILDSLKGNIQQIVCKTGSNMAQMMNIAGRCAKGENLVFLSDLLVPCENWLVVINNAYKKYGEKKLFGAKITNQLNNIVHAGLVLNENNAPVSAYLHLDSDFPKANIERGFQMIDHFICIKKCYLFELGGFWEKTGRNVFMDISLRAQVHSPDPDPVIYLPNLKLIQIATAKNKIDFDDSIYFYGKWHGALWNSREKLYNKDEISKIELDAARLTSATKTV